MATKRVRVGIQRQQVLELLACLLSLLLSLHLPLPGLHSKYPSIQPHDM